MRREVLPVRSYALEMWSFVAGVTALSAWVLSLLP